MKIILFILITIILLILLLINSFYDEKKNNNYRLALIIAISSIVFHFYVYLSLSDGTILAMIVSSMKSISATLKVFGGYTLISDSDLYKIFDQNANYAMLFYYIIHILAFSMTLSALVLAIGKRYIYVLYKYCDSLKFYKNIFIFYKYDENAKKLIKRIQSNQDIKIIILDNDLNNNIELAFNDVVWKHRCIVLGEDLNDKYLLKIISDYKYKKSNIKLLIVNNDIDMNFEFANMFYKIISNLTQHNDISLTVISDDYYDYDNMQANDGFTYVRRFNKKDIISRILIKNYPPCNYVEFENCKAKANESFNCLIIGFGELGQKIFDRLFIYGQFVGCKFNCVIIDENFDNVCAEFESKYDFIFDKTISGQYKFLSDNICINTEKSINAKSKKFYEYLKENNNELDYVVVATNTDKTNNDIVKNLLKLRDKFSNAKYDIFDCLQERIYSYCENESIRDKYDIYDYIIDDSIDVAGELINYAYWLKQDNRDIINVNINDPDIKKDIIDKWNKCKAYEKNSSISAAEFYRTILRVIDKEDSIDYNSVIEYIENLSNDQKDYLGKMEHNRWSAYLLLNGWRYMDYDIKEERHKNKDNKLHASIIPYEKLEELDRIIEHITGQNPQFKINDINNVIMAIRVAEMINKN